MQSLHSFVFPEKSRFDDWTKFQLVTVLVQDGQAIRDEQYISRSILQSFAEAVFLDKPAPNKPVPFTIDEQNKRHTAALTIQNAYFAWMISSMEGTSAPQAPAMHDVILRAMHSGDRDHDASATGQRATLSTRTNTPPRQESREINTGSQDELDIQRELADVEEDLDDTESAQNTILEEEFVPPSLEYAMLYADFNHPRIGGLGGKLMPWLRTSTGMWMHIINICIDFKLLQLLR
jgi:hypothetical protein